MSCQLYDLVGKDDLRFSPYCWRTKMALKHLDLPFTAIPTKFTDKTDIAFAEAQTVPVLETPNAAIYDSWQIALYLEQHHSHHVSLFGGPQGKALAKFMNHWADQQLHGLMLRCLIPHVWQSLHPDDKDYFRQSREKRLKRPFDELLKGNSEKRILVERSLAPLEALLTDQAFIHGSQPMYADYIVFGTFQWARTVGAKPFFQSNSKIHHWFEQLLNLFDGYALQTPIYTASNQ